MDPHHILSLDRAPIVPDDSELKVPVNYDSIDTFDRGQFDGETVRKG